MAKAKTSNPKENTIYIRVDPEFKQHLQDLAKASGLSLSAWVRMKIMEVSGYQPK